MMFVAYDVCRIKTFVANYEVCRLYCLSQYRLLITKGKERIQYRIARGKRLTLIKGALEKNLQLLFKKILHHDALAKYFFKNQKLVTNCMNNIF